MHRRRGIVALVGAVIGASTLFTQGEIGAAQASAPIMTCQETGDVTWLGLGISGAATPTNWTATVLYSKCSGSAVESGGPYPSHLVLSGTEKVQCEGPTTDHQGTGEMTWSDGTTSRVHEGQRHASMSGNSGTGEFAVTIVSGTFEGHEVVEETSLTFSGGLCPMASTATFTGTFTLF